MSTYTYTERFGVNRGLPEQGRPREEILAELSDDGDEEDAFWETGKCSGTMYCGDHEHYAFMNEAFGLFAHVNALQRDMCPSQTQVRGRDHRDDARPDPRRRDQRREPAGLVTGGGTGEHPATPMLAYREQARDGRGITQPNVVKPETAHPAFDKALPPLRHRGAQRRRSTRRPRSSTSTGSPSCIDDEHRRARRLGLQLRLRHDRPDRASCRDARAASTASACTSTAASAASSCRSARSSATTSRSSTSGFPGVTSISADTHKYGYAFKGTSIVAVPRQGAAQRAVLLPDRTGAAASTARPGWTAPARAGCSPRRGRRWSRSAARATCATRKEIFETSAAMQDAVRSHPELRILGEPTFLLQLHVGRVRHLPRQRLHADARLAVQRPAVPERAAHGGDAAADAARRRRGVRDGPRGRGRVRARAARGREAPQVGAIYGGVAGGLTDGGGRVHPRRDGRHDGRPADRALPGA